LMHCLTTSSSRWTSTRAASIALTSPVTARPSARRWQGFAGGPERRQSMSVAADLHGVLIDHSGMEFGRSWPSVGRVSNGSLRVI
jgi:hypothetical protein